MGRTVFEAGHHSLGRHAEPERPQTLERDLYRIDQMKPWMHWIYIGIIVFLLWCIFGWKQRPSEKEAALLSEKDSLTEALSGAQAIILKDKARIDSISAVRLQAIHDTIYIDEKHDKIRIAISTLPFDTLSGYIRAGIRN